MAEETVLVVDDGKDNRDFLVEYVLEPNGYKHLTAKDGEEGLNLAIQNRPDLILLDLQMPRLNGKQVLEQLAARYTWSSCLFGALKIAIKPSPKNLSSVPSQPMMIPPATCR